MLGEGTTMFPRSPELGEGLGVRTSSRYSCFMVNSLEQLEALLEPYGQALLARIAALDPKRDELLNLGTKLRRDYPADLVAAALTLHELRGRAKQKFSRAGEMYFTRAGYEQ